MNALGTRRLAENGFVLVTALMFLVVLTILGLSIMNTNTMEERMAGFFRDRQVALEAAEAGLREAERDILYGTRNIAGGTNFGPVVAGVLAVGCTADGLCKPKTGEMPPNPATTAPWISGDPVWVDLERTNDPGWMRGEDSAYTTKYGTYSSPPSTALPVVAKQPRYIIESITVVLAGSSVKVGYGPQSNSTVYRVTSVGFGRRVSTRVVLQGMLRP